MKKIPFHLSTTRDQHPLPRPISASTHHHHSSQEIPIMKSSSGPTENPVTSSHRQFAPISPSSYRTYNPEWTSVSSDLASSFDGHREFYSAPPRKKLCHLLNPTFRSPLTSHAQGIPGPHPSSTTPLASTPTCYSKSAPYTHFSSLQQQHEFPRKGSCSALPHDAHTSSNLELYDHHKLGTCKYPQVTHPGTMLVDEDRTSSSRPLKNTKRAAQNRAAQRAFRERKDRYVRELEARSIQFEEYILRYGLLEERERLIEAREAELMSLSSKPSSIQDMIPNKKSSAEIGEKDNITHGSVPSEVDKLDYISKLEYQLESSRREITRLKTELLKINDQEEDVDESNRGTVDWERGSEDACNRPQTGSASEFDISGHASSSSDSPSAWCAPKPPTRAHHHPEWIRSDPRCGTDHQASDDADIKSGVNGQWLANRKPTFAAAIESKRDALQSEGSSKVGWSDGSRSPDSLPSSYHRAHSARDEILPVDCDHMSDHHLPSPKLHFCNLPLRRADILEHPGKLVRLPAIHHHLNRSWREDEWKKGGKSREIQHAENNFICGEN